MLFLCKEFFLFRLSITVEFTKDYFYPHINLEFNEEALEF